MSRPLVTLFFCLLSWHIAHGQSSLGQQPTPELEKQHLIEVAEAHFHRLTTWETGDVLIRLRTTATGPMLSSDGESLTSGDSLINSVVERTSMMRIVFDFAAKRFHCISTSEQDLRFYNSNDQEVKLPGTPTHTFGEKIFLFDDEKSIRIATNSSGVFYTIPGMDPPESLLGQFGILQIRGVGISTWREGWDDNSLLKSFNGHFNLDVVEKVSHVGKDRYRTLSRVPVAKSNIQGYRFAVDWDVVNGVPVAYSHFAGFTDDIQKPQHSGNVEWIEMDSQMLPRRIRETSRELMRLRSGQGFVHDEEHELDFHWFSINKDLPPEIFDRDIVEQPGYAARMLSEHNFESKPATPK